MVGCQPQHRRFRSAMTVRVDLLHGTGAAVIMLYSKPVNGNATGSSVMIDARIVANFVLDRASAGRRAITNLDLQKIVYFLHGHYLLRHHRPLGTGGIRGVAIWSSSPGVV